MGKTVYLVTYVWREKDGSIHSSLSDTYVYSSLKKAIRGVSGILDLAYPVKWKSNPDKIVDQHGNYLEAQTKWINKDDTGYPAYRWDISSREVE